MSTRMNTARLQEMKRQGQRIAMLTAYDYPSTRFIDDAGAHMILVGDSLGMVVLGYDSTLPVTLEDMLYHVKAVTRGAQRAFVVADMPFLTYQVSVEDAMRNAGRLMKEGGAHAVKLEGGEAMAPTVARLVSAGIPVQGHIGLTPQSIHQLGGYRVQGRTRKHAKRLLLDALALEAAGAFSIVLEGVPTELARLITQRLTVPIIGIGAGPYCDGQVQVFHDFLGFYPDFVPKHAKQYARVGDIIKAAVQQYITEVQDNTFPASQHAVSMDESLLEGLQEDRR